MSFTDSERRFAGCTNLELCAKAQAGEALEWYRGAGEYCPECGEVLTVREPPAPERTAARAVPPQRGARPKLQPRGKQPPPGNGKHKPADPPTATADEPGPAPVPRPTVPRPDRRRTPPAPGAKTKQRWLWAVLGIFALSLAVGFMMQRRGIVGRAPTDPVAVCTFPLAKGLAADLMLGYSVKSGTPESHLVLSDAQDCDVRFSTAAETPDAVIASDAIVAIVNPLNPVSRLSEKDLRGIFSGAIRDWSQVGGTRGAIVPILPDAATEEAKVLSSSLFYNVDIDRRVLRASTSAEVTRAVTGASRDSRAAIGMVAFGQAISAKVIPLAYLPPPSVVTIASHRYPYTLTIAINQESNRNDPAIDGLIAYAKSSYGAAIVQASGFIPRGGI